MVPKNLAKAVATAGTRVQISTDSLRVVRFVVQAEWDNTGRIYLGGSSVAAANGIELDAKASFSFDVNDAGVNQYTDLSTWYIDSSVNGDGVMVLYFTE